MRKAVALACASFALSGVVAAGPATAPAPTPPTVLAPVASMAGSMATMVPAGDADGDGVPDVEVVHRGSGRLLVLSGSDGRQISTADQPGDAPPVTWRRLAHDVVGGPAPDVLRTALVGRSTGRTCDVYGECQVESSWTWEVSVHDQVGGPAHWVHQRPAALSEVDNGGSARAMVERRRSWSGVDDVLEVRVVPDGRRGTVVVTTRSTQGRLSHGIGLGGRATQTVTATTARLASLDRTGRVVVRRDLRATPVLEQYQLLGDVTADGRIDLALVEPRPDGGRDAHVVAADLSPRWTTPLHQASHLDRMATGSDRRPRVAVVSPGLVVERDGIDGAERNRTEWRVAAGRVGLGPLHAVAYEPVSSGSAGGDGTHTVSVRVGGYDLASARFLGWSATHVVGTFPADEGPTSFAGHDVDGDGRIDLVGQAYERGIQGGRLVTVTRAGSAFVGPDNPYATPWSAIELDGRAGTEVLFKSYSPQGDAWDTVFAYRPGQRLWAMSRARFDGLVVLPSSAGADWLELAVGSGGDPVVRRLDGETLDVRWEVRAS